VKFSEIKCTVKQTIPVYGARWGRITWWSRHNDPA